MQSIFLAAALMLATPAAAAPAPVLLSTGLAAYTAGDFTAARTAFLSLVDAGSAIAETMVGTMVAHGQGGPRDPAAAVAYYYRAADRGYPPAQLALARALARGIGVAVDRPAALLWARLAAQRGDARVVAAARAELAALATTGTPAGVARDADDWRPWPSGRD